MAARAATAAAALLGAALTVGAGPVYAAPNGGPTVEFSGGSMLNLLVCKSSPSSGKVTVPADSRVTFVNRLGQTATLKVDGKAVSQVGANQAVPVVFHYGPADVSMTFNCGVGVVEEFKAVGVTVTAAGPAANTGQAPAAGRTGSGAKGTGGIAARGGSSPGSTTKSSHGGGTGAKTSGANGTSPTDPAAASTNNETTEPIDSSLFGSDPSAAPLAAGAPSAPGEGQVYVEAAVPASGTPRNGPVGLLALIAAVCVVGVGIAAIRAIIAQRSTRASYA
jgi:hypothetical protein